MSDDRDVDGFDPDADGEPASRWRRLRAGVARTARIARWEVTRTTGTVDRKTLLLVLATVVVAGVVGLSVADDGLGLEEEIYVVGVDEDDPYYDVAVESEEFRPIPLSAVAISDGDGNADVVVLGDGRIGYHGPNGEAAYDAFQSAVETYNEHLMAAESDETAAYPVLVDLEYRTQAGSDSTAASETTDDDGAAGGIETDTGQETATDEGDAHLSDDDAEGGNGGTDDGSESDSTAGETDERGADDEPTVDGDEGSAGAGDRTASTDDGMPVPDVGDGTLESTGTSPGSPSTLSPPFPFESLVLAFLFVVPMNFVIQAYGSTIMDERINRRGELLLVSPAARREIVAGKTLPYLLGLAAISTVIALAIDGGVLSIAAVFPIAVAFLAATFAGAMFARSFKELTFVTVTISVVLTTYVFVPAIFTDVTPIALISPLTLIVMDLQGEAVSLGEYAFSTGTFYLGGAVLFLLGIGVYREEDMFAQKPIPAKIVDAIVAQIDAITARVHRNAAPFALSILFIPFVFAGQLLVVALLFAVPDALALPIVFVLAAAIEEFAKSIHVYAGVARSRFDRSLRVGVVLGTLSGVGFFVGEKFTQIVQLVGLPELDVAVAAFGPAISSDPLVLVALFFAPMVLHVGTAVIGALGATRGRAAYAVAFLLATLVHSVYNLGVITLVA
ncbi:ABC transporter permease [Halopiger goleimassiliensis]|uniref:ABC transporter permease n=1 Tax=Halopiger goleimassiliensis TaxID=1293048 RepID=UPI000677BE5A|nr:ABC transporter permease [Halopiger goleimassiliensis]